jgi:hypothetical protein
MKYKRLFTEDGFYNEDGQIFLDEYEEIILPFIQKYMLLDFDCKDIECIMMRAIPLPITSAMMKRLHGLNEFKKD